MTILGSISAVMTIPGEPRPHPPLLPQSVLQQQAVRFHEHGDLLATLHEQHSMAGQGSMTKKQGVSGESCFQNKTAEKIHIQRFDKDFR